MQFRRFQTRRLKPTSSRPEWLFLVPGMLLVILFSLPVLALFVRAAGDNMLASALSPMALSALRLSLTTSLVSVIITLIVGTPLAYILAHWDLPGHNFIEILVDLPVVLPPSVAGLALLIAFGRQGLFGSWLAPLGIQIPFTPLAVVIAQVFVSAPLFVRSARVGFASIDPQLEEASHVEGASQWHIFRYIMFPLAAKALASGAILTWTRALGEFGATILFAGNLEGVTQTMPLAIYLGFERNLGVAVVLSIQLILVSALLLLVMRKLDSQRVD